MTILFQNSYFNVIPVSSKIAQWHSILFRKDGFDVIRKDGFDVIPKNEIRCYSATPQWKLVIVTANQ
jgi:hypothetical protein